MTERYEILCLETAEEYIAKKKIEEEEDRISHAKYKKEIEAKGKCEYCKAKEYLRWVDDEFYMCYDCYYEGMKQAGEFHSYHGCRAEDMDGFIDDGEWDALWEEENES